MIRGPPNKFSQNDVTVNELDQLECPVPFGDHEELSSAILDLTSRYEDHKVGSCVCNICVLFSPRNESFIKC